MVNAFGNSSNRGFLLLFFFCSFFFSSFFFCYIFFFQGFSLPFLFPLISMLPAGVSEQKKRRYRSSRLESNRLPFEATDKQTN